MPSEGGGSGAGVLWGEDPFKGWPVSLLTWGEGSRNRAGGAAQIFTWEK